MTEGTQVARPDTGEYDFHDLVGYKGMSLHLKKKLTWDEAEYAGNVLVFMDKQVQFAIGDYMTACVGLFGDDAYQLAIFDYSISRLKTMKQIAERIVPAIRREDLEFSFHEEVAYIPPELQEEWLGKAKQYKWTVKDLHEALIGAGLKEPRKEREPKLRKVLVCCPECEHEFDFEVEV